MIAELLFHYFIRKFKIKIVFRVETYRYFSAKAIAKAERNLSTDTWTSGVNSFGNIVANTTRMQCDRIWGEEWREISNW